MAAPAGVVALDADVIHVGAAVHAGAEVGLGHRQGLGVLQILTFRAEVSTAGSDARRSTERSWIAQDA